MSIRPLVAVATVLVIAGGILAARDRPDQFSHVTHARLFPGSCTTCHVGPVDSAASFWPEPTSCAACHDGEVAPVVEWSPRTDPPASNLRFVHASHAQATADSVTCTQCHLPDGRQGEVHLSQASQCVSCHQPGVEHLDVQNLQCSTCHVPLSEAARLSESDIAAFPVPQSHLDPSFGLGGHGGLLATGRAGDAQRCSTCHARNFCMNCHVNAPETPAILALATDPRSLVHRFNFAAPPSHATTAFATAHGREASRDQQRCATCHTRPSCVACHAGEVPRAVGSMPLPGEDRAVGAQVMRSQPASHTRAFREGHGTEAGASPRSCSTCHVRQDCLSCHRPENGRSAGDYHPVTFLARHPTAAYSRQVTCSDCHNTLQFCASCHQQSGLGGGNTLGGGSFHDGKAAFFVGHGQAARQSLESCVSCHAERDCTSCHSALGGRRFSPHGPGFDAERMRRKNPEMCIACHLTSAPP